MSVATTTDSQAVNSARVNLCLFSMADPRSGSNSLSDVFNGPGTESQTPRTNRAAVGWDGNLKTAAGVLDGYEDATPIANTRPLKQNREQNPALDSVLAQLCSWATGKHWFEGQ